MPTSTVFLATLLGVICGVLLGGAIGGLLGGMASFLMLRVQQLAMRVKALENQLEELAGKTLADSSSPPP